MNKRGQVSIFVIIGIVLIILILLFIFLQNKVYIGPASRENLEAQFPHIKEHIEGCIREVALPRLRQIGLQGGFMEPTEGTYRLDKNYKVSFLCYNIPDILPCRSRVLTFAHMEKELSEFIQKDLTLECLNIHAFDKVGLHLTQGRLEINTSIGHDSILIEADLPITISKGASKVERSEFSHTIDIPLGRLYEAARDIVNVEATTGDFDTLVYSLAKTQLTGKPYIIQRLQPYPDELYIMKIKDTPSEEDPYIFQFFVEGEPQ